MLCMCLCKCACVSPPTPLQSLGYEIIPVICRLLNPETGAGFPGQAAICHRSPLLFLHISTWLAGTRPQVGGATHSLPAGSGWRQQRAETLTVADGEGDNMHACSCCARLQVYGHLLYTHRRGHTTTQPHRGITMTLNKFDGKVGISVYY